MYAKFFKRLLDIVCSLLAIIVFSWLYVILAVLVQIKLGSPVIFKQERPGKDEKPFKLYKFRTMTDARDENGKFLHDDKRLTKFGKFLRSTSLDELPEAFNILKGDMSVIGPRPLLMEYLPYYNDEEHHRHDVRPGLSGWAQVNGRNAVSWEQKFTYDLEYIEKCSFAFDAIIILRTIKKFIKREDVQVGSEIKAGRFDDHRKRQAAERENSVSVSLR